MKTTEQKNRMIADFMGFELQTNQDERWFNQWFTTPNGVWSNRIEILHFDTSWDWLMPVIKEISNKTGYVYVMYDTDSYFTNIGDSFYFGGGFESIEQTHIAVVQFIEWYNEQKF